MQQLCLREAARQIGALAHGPGAGWASAPEGVGRPPHPAGAKRPRQDLNL